MLSLQLPCCKSNAGFFTVFEINWRKRNTLFKVTIKGTMPIFFLQNWGTFQFFVWRSCVFNYIAHEYSFVMNQTTVRLFWLAFERRHTEAIEFSFDTTGRSDFNKILTNKNKILPSMMLSINIRVIQRLF